MLTDIIIESLGTVGQLHATFSGPGHIRSWVARHFCSEDSIIPCKIILSQIIIEKLIRNPVLSCKELHLNVRDLAISNIIHLKNCKTWLWL